MHKKWMFVCLFFFAIPISYAETCPSVRDIKQLTLHGFKMVDSDTNQPLPPKRMTLFKKKIKAFALAEWVDHLNQEGTIHCYYRDQNGSELETYLAKKYFIPVNANQFWYKVSGSMHCAAPIQACIFQSTHAHQLATK